MTIASRNDFVPRFSVYQLGRRSEPVIVVGRVIPDVAVYMTPSRRQRVPRAPDCESGSFVRPLNSDHSVFIYTAQHHGPGRSAEAFALQVTGRLLECEVLSRAWFQRLPFNQNENSALIRNNRPVRTAPAPAKDRGWSQGPLGTNAVLYVRIGLAFSALYMSSPTI